MAYLSTTVLSVSTENETRTQGFLFKAAFQNYPSPSSSSPEIQTGVHTATFPPPLISFCARPFLSASFLPSLQLPLMTRQHPERGKTTSSEPQLHLSASPLHHLQDNQHFFKLYSHFKWGLNSDNGADIIRALVKAR